jgi:hypothetical protein
VEINHLQNSRHLNLSKEIPRNYTASKAKASSSLLLKSQYGHKRFRNPGIISWHVHATPCYFFEGTVGAGAPTENEILIIEKGESA